jgi:uncharacterized protein (TIGR02145 family)
MYYKISAVLIVMAIAFGPGCSAPVKDNPAGPQDAAAGTFTDPRDGRTYKTITIGSQTWMAQNLNVGTRIDGDRSPADNGLIEKYAYDDLEARADTLGGLYLWPEAMAYDTVEGAPGICPPGWHLPSDAEWKTLELKLGMSADDANTVGWRGTDQGAQLLAGGTSGFEALFSGYRYNDGSFILAGAYTGFWTSTPFFPNIAWLRYLEAGNDGVNRYYLTTARGFCVRCVRD